MLNRQVNDAVKALDDGRWGPLAALIQHVRRHESWRDEFRNFSDWINHQAAAHGLSQARCWRYKASGAYYETLRERHTGLPELKDLPAGISAEALELLEKLERVAQKGLIEEMTVRALAGDMPIRELKQVWATYKPALQANSPGDAVEGARQLEADCVLALSKQRAWTGHQNPVRCHVYRSVPDSTNRREFDAVALVQGDRTAEAEVHVFEIKLASKSAEAQWKFQAWSKEADFCWAVTNATQPLQILERLEPHVGLLALIDGQLNVSRSAIRQETDQTLTPFVRTLLLRALRS
ncbi:hypothetical protein RM531_07465 [Salinisphaera sp. P385]|uniref:Uncharacterized protein n=1 Tax=Spectribacter acetivorans TaxID=3075603 RepID=A0ABU3B770_9GAMM|nr:hypothetical protein [Salinisphaera sp. P385]MDT0618310.1 hypothetical protein [Salinisphaera sp. P385]